MNEHPIQISSIQISSIDDRLACLDRIASTLYSIGCRITAGDHDRVERLMAETVRDLPTGVIATDEVIIRFARQAIADDASRQRAALELHAVQYIPAATLGDIGVPPMPTDQMVANDELRGFDRWMDDSVLDRCRTRLLTGDRCDTARTAARDVGGTPRVPRRRKAIAAATALTGVAAIAAMGIIDGAAPTIMPTTAPGPAASASNRGYVVDEVPTGFSAAGAFVRAAPDAGGWLQVWAAPGASRTSGDWIALATIGRGVSGRFVLDGGQPTTIAGQPATSATATDGIEQLSVQLIDGGRVTIAGHGSPADDLAAVATEMVIANGSIGFDSASALLDSGLELIASRPSPYGTLGSSAQVGTSWTSTYQSADLGRRILLSSRASTPNDLEVAQFILTADTTSDANDRVIDVDGREVAVSTETGFDGKTTSTLQWHDGANTITLSGTADLQELVATVEQIRPATDDEWRRMESLPPNYYPL